MKKFILGFVVIVALAVIVPVALVMTNLLPLALADALPIVKTFVVHGEVRMQDGSSRPQETVTVEVRTAKGKSRQAEADPDSGSTYSMTFMGFTDPVLSGDALHIRATMPLPAPLAGETVAEEGDRILIAEFHRRVYDAATTPLGPDNEIFLEKRIRVLGEAPADVAGWGEVPLASAENLVNLANPALRHVGVDSEVRIVARVQAMAHVPGAKPFRVTMPPTDDLELLRAMSLSTVGEILTNEPFVWSKKRVSVPFTTEVRAGTDTTVMIVDAAQAEVRLERLGTTSRSDPIEWGWDGRNNDGEFAPEGTYTFIAVSNSLGIGAAPREYIAEVRGRGATRVRYGRFTPQSVVGDFLDTFGLSVAERATAGGGMELELAESIRLFDAMPDGEPRATVRTLRGNETISSFAAAFGMVLDPVVRVADMMHIGRYRLMVTGGARLRPSGALEDLESMDSVTSREEFLQLAASRINSVQGTKKEPLVDVDEKPLELKVLMEKEEGALEDWEFSGTLRPIPPIVVEATDTLESVLNRINAVPDVSVSMRGTIDLDSKYDARVSGPKGVRVSFYRGEIPEPGALTANIRAAGLYSAQAVTSGVSDDLLADGSTAFPIEVKLIGLDGSHAATDTIAAKASSGSIRDLSASNGVYRGMYTPPVLAADTTVDLELTSQVLQAKHAEQPEGMAVLHKAALSVPLVGAEPVDAPDDTAQASQEVQTPATTENGATLNGQTAAQTVIDPQDLKKRAKLIAELKPETAAQLMALLPLEQARALLLVMSPRDAGKIVDAMMAGDATQADSSPQTDARKRSLAEIFGGTSTDTSATNP